MKIYLQSRNRGNDFHVGVSGGRTLMIRHPLPEPAWHVMLLWLTSSLTNLPPPHRQIPYTNEYERSVIFAASVATPHIHGVLGILRRVPTFWW